MKVVFVKNVNNVAMLGEVKEVAKGFAFNYLIPQKLALPATQANVEKVSSKKKVEVAKVEQKKQVKSKVAQQLQGYSLSLSAKADDKGTFFAGITKESIAKELNDKGIDVTAKQIVLDEPIKKAGKNTVKVKVETETVEINVIAKED